MDVTMTVFDSVIASVKKEFEGFEHDMMRRGVKEVFDEHWKISCYCELHGYICDKLKEDFDEEDVEILVGMPDILYQAYETYLGSEGASFNSYADDKELLEGLIEELKEAYGNE